LFSRIDGKCISIGFFSQVKKPCNDTPDPPECRSKQRISLKVLNFPNAKKIQYMLAIFYSMSIYGVYPVYSQTCFSTLPSLAVARRASSAPGAIHRISLCIKKELPFMGSNHTRGSFGIPCPVLGRFSENFLCIRESIRQRSY
jgi:hypothetical protein